VTELKGLGEITAPPLYKVKMKKFKDTSGASPEGLAWDGTYLWSADENDVRIRKLDPRTGDIISTITPDHPPEGLAWDSKGPYLWYCDELDTDSIYKLNPKTGNVLDSFPAPHADPDGLTWDGENLWNSDDGTGEIYKIDPGTGNVLKSFASPGPNPDGLAWDGDQLWCCDESDFKFTLLGTEGTVAHRWSSPEGSEAPSGLAWGWGTLWMSMDTDSEIWKISDIIFKHLEVL